MNRLKDLRLKMGLSQQALADKLNVSQQTICKYENNTNEPNIDMLEAMADIFDVSVDYLIGYSSYAHKVEEVSETALNEDELTFLKKISFDQSFLSCFSTTVYGRIFTFIR